MQPMLRLLEWQLHKMSSMQMRMSFKNIVSKRMKTDRYYLGNNMSVLYITCKTYDQSWGPKDNQPDEI